MQEESGMDLDQENHLLRQLIQNMMYDYLQNQKRTALPKESVHDILMWASELGVIDDYYPGKETCGERAERWRRLCKDYPHWCRRPPTPRIPY